MTFVFGVIFLIAVIGTVIFYNKGGPADAEFSQGDPILKEIEDLRISFQGLGPSVSVFPRCRAVVSEKKVVLEQKALFSKKYVPRFVFYRHASEANDGIRKGVFHLTLRPDEVRIETGKKKYFLEIVPTDHRWIRWIKIFTQTPEELKTYLIP